MELEQVYNKVVKLLNALKNENLRVRHTFIKVFIESMSDLFTDFIIYERNSDDSNSVFKILNSKIGNISRSRKCFEKFNE